MSKWEVKVRKISKVMPHENADRLDVARADGFDWDIVVGKDQFKVGDLAVYVPIESILPQNLVDTIFKDSKVKPHNGRVKAVKIRQKVSYGLLLTPQEGMKNGDDVAEKLGIVKWEPPEFLPGTRSFAVKKRNQNLYFKEYVDIENIKYYPNTFGYDEGDVIITEKIHGTNFRFGKLKKSPGNWFQKIWNRVTSDHEFVVGSHHVQQNPLAMGKTWLEQRGLTTGNVYLETVKKLNAKEWCPDNYIFFGEIYGKGIQDMNYGLNEPSVAFFDVMYIDPVTGEDRYLNYDEFTALCDDYGLERVPELYRGPWNQDCLNYRTGLALAGTNREQLREGCVVKTVIEKRNSLLGRTILKVINEEYLLRDKGTEFH